MSGDRDEDGFLSRWSRRKAEARAAPPPEPEPEAPPAEPSPPPEPEMTAEEIAALPPIETAGADELKAYLRKGVPAALKTLAMRRMWAANPLIRDHVDPALDYAFDWNTPGLAPWSPLGAGDDARALADRILKGPDRQAEAAGPDVAQDAPAAADEGGDGVAASASAEPAPPAASVAPDSDVEAPARSSQTHASETESPSPAPAARTARRRHGGAVPS